LLAKSNIRVMTIGIDTDQYSILDSLATKSSFLLSLLGPRRDKDDDNGGKAMKSIWSQDG
jgi:hypothetical protein